MITFEKIRWKNFLSTGNQFTEINLAIDSEAKFSKNSTTLIVGTNGAERALYWMLLLLVCLINHSVRLVRDSWLIL